MKVAPWVKWYAGDFLQGVAELGPHEGWVYTVVLNLIYDRGEAIPDDMSRLARRCNMRPTSVAKAVDHLVAAGKLARSGGLLTNDRAEREMKSRQEVGEKSAKNISQRWQKVREKANENNDAAIPTLYETDTDAIPTRSQKPENYNGAFAPIEPAAPDPFEVFWQAYPKRDGANPKKPAKAKFEKLVKLGADPEQIISAACHFANQHPKPTPYVPQATRWLNEERFRDDGAAPSMQPVGDEQWSKRLTYARRERQWAKVEWGAIPGSPGCRVPAHLLEPGDGDGWVAQREAA